MRGEEADLRGFDMDAKERISIITYVNESRLQVSNINCKFGTLKAEQMTIVQVTEVKWSTVSSSRQLEWALTALASDTFV